MPDENWQKAKKIFNDALRQKTAERRQFLDRVCGGDDGLRGEVESLLVSYDGAESFLETPAVGEVADVIKSGGEKLETGRRFGHYEIVRKIGAGGMGEVYLARGKKLDRRVAVKILNEKFAGHQSNLQRFIQEAKAASALNHPNILVIHEIGETGEANYIVSEFIEGKTLHDLFGEKSLRLSEFLDIAIQIAGALCTAHESFLIHRDIKPENIMIRPDGYVKILDFGLAKLVERKNKSILGLEDETIRQNQTARGVILGTINYMSPEQAKGAPVDERTDVFSLGVVIYEMIAGRTPFAGDSVSETFANLINQEPPPLARYASNVPEELQRIVSKMLRKNTDERYQTMKDVFVDLKSLRETLAFDERLERSASPVNGNAAARRQATTADAVNKPTGETNYNFTGPIKRRRPFAVFAALAVLLAGAIGFGYYFWSAGNASSGADGKKSIAVLPFANASQDPNAEYLSDGVTESIINNLSQLSGLRVMSRNSAFRFKANQSDTKNIAAQLGVETLVTGDIRQIGDRLLINVRLIDAADDSQIWGNQYVKTSGDIIAAQTEIAQAVAQNLRLKLTNAEQRQLEKRYTNNAEAYELYLRGRFHFFKVTPPEMRKAVDFYEQAIEADPNYALALAGLADAYRTQAITAYAPAREVCPRAKRLAMRALEIDESLADAHIVLGWLGFFYDWDWENAERHLKRAVELAPHNSEAHRAHAHFLSIVGRHEEAIAEGRKARELAPLTLITATLEGQFLYYAGRYDEAIARLNKTLELDPNFWASHLNLGRVYILQERWDEAIAALEKARELSGGSNEPVTQLGYALAKSGRREEARATLEDLKSAAAENYVPAYFFATVHNGLGEREAALNYLEKSFAEREAQITFIKIDRRWDNLRNEPRFASLMRRMNFE